MWKSPDAAGLDKNDSSTENTEPYLLWEWKNDIFSFLWILSNDFALKTTWFY